MHNVPDSEASDDQALARVIAGRLDLAAVSRAIRRTITADISGYRRLPAATLEREIQLVVETNVRLIARTILEGHVVSEMDLDPFRESAKDRANEGMPLEDLLGAYRLGSRQLWRAIRAATYSTEAEALGFLADRLMQYIDGVSSAVARAYLDERQHLVSEQERRLRRLFEAIVVDRPLSAELRELAARFGLLGGHRLIPFVGRLPAGTTRTHSDRSAQLRTGGTFTVTEGKRYAGIAATSSPVPEPANDEILVVGEPTPRADLQRALVGLRAAATAAEAAGRTGLVRIDAYLYEVIAASAPEVVRSLERAVLAPLERHDLRRAGNELVRSLQVYLVNNLNRAAAARELNVHPNTLDARLRRVAELAHIDVVHRVDDVVKASLAVNVADHAISPVPDDRMSPDGH